MGRKRYTKLSYLFHRYTEGKTEGYLKKAAGPYNPNTRYKGPEKIALTNRYITSQKSGKYSGFIAGDEIEKAQQYFNNWYKQEVLQWLKQFRYKKNDELELLTTVDMAIQDLKEEHKEISVERVKEVMQNNNEWKTKLTREIFSDNNIAKSIRESEKLFGIEHFKGR